MTLVGAAALIVAWGRLMTYKRGGVVQFQFHGRRVEIRPVEEQLIESQDQHNFRIYALVSEFHGLRPQKFDTIVDEYGDEYTVQRGHFAGADVDELVKMQVTGGHI